MSQQVLTIEVREKVGKGVCRKLRKAGKIPGVVYGKGMESVAVTLNPKELSVAVAGEGGQNNLITLKGAGQLDGATVIVSSLERDCLKGNPLHVDLHKISMTEKLRVTVPLSLVGTAAGVKAGGLLDALMHEVEVECLPGDIPENIELDLTPLVIGDTIHVSDLVVPEGVKILAEPKAAIVTILGKPGGETAAE
jgi:large subunit ribosomal protein L25